MARTAQGKKKMVQVAKGKKLPKSRVEKIRNKPGGSSVGDFPNVKPSNFAGSNPGTFPIDTKAHAKSALKLAHNDPNPEKVKQKVFKKYPELKPDNKKK